MLPQQFLQSEKPNKPNIFKDVGLPVILVLATVLGSIIGAIILGTTHVIGFSWLLLIWGCIMFGIVVFFAWYSLRTRFILQKNYQTEIEALRKEFRALQSNFIDAANHEFNRLNTMFTDYTRKNEKEQNERLGEMGKRLIEKIMDAKNEMDIRVENAQTFFSGALDSCKRAVDLYREQLIQAERRMNALQEQLKKGSSPENQEEPSETPID